MKSLCTLAVLCMAIACSTPRATTFNHTSSHQALSEQADSTTYARLTFVADQKDYLPMMLGPWLVHTMRRQTTLPEETLNLPLHLNGDQTFVASTSCGDIRGKYSVKGVSIRFLDVSYSPENCSNTAQFDEMVRLLTNTVSLYAVNGNMLFLKDNSGNNVFRATR